MRKQLIIFTCLAVAAMAMVLGGYWLWSVTGGRVPVQNTKALPPRGAMEPDALGGDDLLAETPPAPVIPEGFDFLPLMPSEAPIKIAPDNPATASQQAKAIATIPETDDAGVPAERQIFETLSLPAVSTGALGAETATAVDGAAAPLPLQIEVVQLQPSDTPSANDHLQDLIRRSGVESQPPRRMRPPVSREAPGTGGILPESAPSGRLAGKGIPKEDFGTEGKE